MRAQRQGAGFLFALVLAACSGADLPPDASSGSGGSSGDGGNGTPSAGPGSGPTTGPSGTGASAVASTGEGPAGPGSGGAGPAGPGATTTVGTGGTSGVGGGGGEGGSGGAPADCTGDWVGPPERMLELFDGTPGSVAVSRGELEMHFVLYQGGLGRIMRSVRASVAVPFPSPTLAEDLDVCDFDEDPYLDVSEDGLRAYVTCAPIDDFTNQDTCPDGGCAILLAERASPADDFEVTDTVGYAGFHPSLRADELEVVTNGMVLSPGVPPKVARRGSTGVDFDAAADVPIQLSGLAAVSGSTISNDGLELYAFARAEGLGETGLARFTRGSTAEPFGARQPIALWGGTTQATGAPDLTPDCRGLYVVRLASDGNGIDRIAR